MNCPNCNAVLAISEKQGIEIDICPNCRGIWLDRGELDKIIERSSNVSFNQNYQQNEHSNHRNHHDDHNEYGNQNQQGYYNQHRKKSWLNELFD
ncbi:MAG: zf-TFIIB domain-containing protein [Bacteroidales bacterium]